MSSTLFFDPQTALYHFPGLEIRHAITTRHSFNQADFNLSFHTGDHQKVAFHRDLLKRYFDGANHLTIPKQCHGVHIHDVSAESHSTIPEDTDALVTNVRGHILGVLSADCVPVLLYDPVQSVLGLAHAGWKGTVATIAPLTLARMVNGYGSKAEDIKVYLGPSISPAHFEVGEEVAQRFNDQDLDEAVYVTQDAFRIDLWKANAILLCRAGIKAQHLYFGNACTYEGNSHFYSARKEGFGTGRFGVFAML
jgi:polyphenol oxidase